MSMLRRVFPLFAVVATLVALGGCSEPKPRQRITLKPAEISLAGHPKVGKKHYTGATLIFPFKVQNPNNVSIELERMNLDASINQTALGTNVQSPGVRVGPGAVMEVPINYDVSYISAGMGVLDALSNQNAKVTVVGDALISCAESRYDAEPLKYPFQIK
jgi:LEA14-like dessication related protein